MRKYINSLILPVFAVSLLHGPASAQSRIQPSSLDVWAAYTCGPLFLGAAHYQTQPTTAKTMAYPKAFMFCSLTYGALKLIPLPRVAQQTASCIATWRLLEQARDLPRASRPEGILVMLAVQTAICGTTAATEFIYDGFKTLLSVASNYSDSLVFQEQLDLLATRRAILSSQMNSPNIDNTERIDLKRQHSQVSTLLTDLMRIGKVETVKVKGGELVLECGGNTLGFSPN